MLSGILTERAHFLTTAILLGAIVVVSILFKGCIIERFAETMPN